PGRSGPDGPGPAGGEDGKTGGARGSGQRCLAGLPARQAGIRGRGLRHVLAGNGARPDSAPPLHRRPGQRAGLQPSRTRRPALEGHGLSVPRLRRIRYARPVTITTKFSLDAALDVLSHFLLAIVTLAHWV